MKNMLAVLRKDKGLTQRELATQIGWSQEDVSRAENGKTKLTDNKIRKLADFFNVNSSVILGDEKILMEKRYNVIDSFKKQSERNQVHFGPDTIPILGLANGSPEALILNFDEPIGEILRHPNQVGMKGSFALYARGESMSPRYMSGDPVYVIANKPPSKDQDCIIELTNGESYLKRFTKQTNKELICYQYNPPREWKRLSTEIKAIHAVVGRG